MNKGKTNRFRYRLGSILTAILALCLASAAIGITVKFLFWLF